MFVARESIGSLEEIQPYNWVRKSKSFYLSHNFCPVSLFLYLHLDSLGVILLSFQACWRDGQQSNRPILRLLESDIGNTCNETSRSDTKSTPLLIRTT